MDSVSLGATHGFLGGTGGGAGAMSEGRAQGGGVPAAAAFERARRATWATGVWPAFGAGVLAESAEQRQSVSEIGGNRDN